MHMGSATERHHGMWGQVPAYSRQPLPDIPRFGKQEPSEKPPKREDPKPGLSSFNARQAVLMLWGLVSFWQIPTAANDFHNWAARRANQTQGKTETTPKPPPTIPLVDDLQNGFLDTIAGWDNSIRSGPVSRYLMDLTAAIFAWEFLYLGVAAQRGILKRSIRPDQLWNELNQRGVTGKSMKVGIVDSGFLSTSGLPKDRVQFFTPDNFKQEAPPYDGAGHGTAVANLIAQGSPESSFIVVSYTTPAQEKAIQNSVMEFFKKGKENPESITLAGLRQLFKPMIENIANGVIKSVDSGASVVNVSLSVEQAVQMQLIVLKALNKANIGLKRLLGLAGVTPSDKAKETLAKYKAFEKKLTELAHANEVSETVNEEIKSLYKPWLEALDYAHAKGVPVVVAAGNSGGHNAKAGNLIGNVNLLAAFKHPALIVVGSTNSKGEVSDFTSEMNDEVMPLVAGNGSGELRTEIVAQRGILSKLWSPMGGLIKEMQYATPKGTSFAAPDITLLYLKMKGVNPDLTPSEAKEILAATAEKAHFTPQYLKLLKEKITAQLTYAETLEKLKILSDSKALVSALAEEIKRVAKDDAIAAAMIENIRFEEKNGKLALLYQRPFNAIEKKILANALEATFNTLLENSLDVKINDADIEKALEKALKRRVGNGMVRRYDAVAEAEKRYQEKSKQEKSKLEESKSK